MAWVDGKPPALVVERHDHRTRSLPCRLASAKLDHAGRVGRGGRAVECSGLENRRARKGLVSSNLTHAVVTLHVTPSWAMALNVRYRQEESNERSRAKRTISTFRARSFPPARTAPSSQPPGAPRRGDGRAHAIPGGSRHQLRAPRDLPRASEHLQRLGAPNHHGAASGRARRARGWDRGKLAISGASQEPAIGKAERGRLGPSPAPIMTQKWLVK